MSDQSSIDGHREAPDHSDSAKIGYQTPETTKAFETIARLPGGLSEQIAVEGRNCWWDHFFQEFHHAGTRRISTRSV